MPITPARKKTTPDPGADQLYFIIDPVAKLKVKWFTARNSGGNKIPNPQKPRPSCS